MSDWYTTTIEFLDKKPSPDEVMEINSILKKMDYDFPSLTSEGMGYMGWRNPQIDLQNVLNVVHQHGFPCKGWSIHEETCNDYYFAIRKSDWIFSK